jgi:hypothetical protein
MVAKFRGGGQACTAANRFYVHAAVAGQFAARFGAAIESLRVGPASDPASQIGPLVSARAADGVRALVSEAISEGAAVAHQAIAPADGWYVAPTLLTGVRADARILDQEIFGPIAPIVEWEDVQRQPVPGTPGFHHLDPQAPLSGPPSAGRRRSMIRSRPARRQRSCKWQSLSGEDGDEETPPFDGTRPSAASTHSSTTRLCSSCDSVGDSPVVPTGTTPCEPSPICQSTKSWKAFSSTAPFLNGVMSAVIEPLNMMHDPWRNGQATRQPS